MGMDFIVGIDDTDNLESRGTGHRARMLGLGLMESSIAELTSITRHQLFVSPLIPYTSHNSSASLVFKGVKDKNLLIDYCRNFLLRESAEGSDAGLCIAETEVIGKAVQEWGRKAKSIVLKMDDAKDLANKSGIFLEGLTGEKCGIIGALAAVGLRKEGNDGRLLWLRHLRETSGLFTVAEIKQRLLLDQVLDMDLNPVASNETVLIGDWSRPVMMNNSITLLLQKNHTNEEPAYTSAPKEFIKSISG
ncbi:MAG: hypothetical protein IPH88_11925 [Bacteroidales bacterium]|nr:hypothetical protein [Bacteroidales bacterium]